MSFMSPTPIDTKFKRETRDCMYHANTDLSSPFHLQLAWVLQVSYIPYLAV